MPDTNSTIAPAPTVPSLSPKHSSKTPRLIAGAALFFLLVGVVVVFASPSLRKRILPSEDAHELFLKMFDRVLEMNSASYEGNVALGIEPRAPGSQPFSFVSTEAADQKAKLDRDVNRFRDLEEIGRKLVDPTAALDALMHGGQGSPISFPAAIDRLGVNIKDPLTGIPYRYVRAPDGQGATLTITFETGEAIDTITHRGQSGFFPMPPQQEEGPTISGQAVTFRWPSYSYSYSFSGKPSQPLLADFFGGEGDFLTSLPANLNVAIRTNGITAKVSAAPTDARFAIQGNARYGTFMVDLSGDLVKKERASYVRITMSPLGFFLDFSPIKDTWIKIMPEDIHWSGIPFLGFWGIPGSVPFGDQKGMKLLEHLQLLLRVAKEEQALVESGEPTSETVDGASTYRYALKLNKEKVVPFYTRLTEQAEAQFGNDAIVRRNVGTLSYLESQSFVALFDYLKNQMEFTVWIDRASGYPVRFRYVLRYIPAETARQLAGNQLAVSFDIKLADINKPAPVAIPESFISFGDAEDLMSGFTKEEGLFSRQTKNVTFIQGALKDYFLIARRYPEKLEDMLITRKDLQAKYPMRSPASFPSGSNPFSGFGFGSLASLSPDGKLLSVVPHDVYTGASYEYRLQGTDDYRLRYTIQTPSFSGKINSMIGRQIDRYADGVNTATASTDSLEIRSQQLDSDGDGLSDRLERYYGTDPNKRDTDGDGYTDNDEIMRGYDPKGPGRLEHSETFPFFGL